MGSTTSNIKEYFKVDLQNLHNKVRHFLKTIILPHDDRRSKDALRETSLLCDLQYEGNKNKSNEGNICCTIL